MPETFACERCGELHDGPPFAWAFESPAYWSAELETRDDPVLGEEQCVVRGEHFFVRGRIVLSVIGAADDFHMQPVGSRPLIELEPTDHPLAVEQRVGFSVVRVRRFAAELMHGES